MESPTSPAFVPRGQRWASYGLSALPLLALIVSGVMKLARPPALAEGFAHLGWPVDLATHLGVLEIACAIVYLIPRTSILGAILLTGYLGGATATHVRVGDGAFTWSAPVFFGILLWAALFLREPRLRALLPLRT